MGSFEIGVRFEIGPLPHDPASTKYIPAGGITFGVEYRQVDQAALMAAFGAEATQEHAPEFDEEGVSIHVFATEGQQEHLRFDCFAGDAHYHYITPGSHQQIVMVDQVANGPVLPWTLRALEQHLPALLDHTGAHELAVEASSPEVREALAAVRNLAESIVREQAAAKTAVVQEVGNGS